MTPKHLNIKEAFTTGIATAFEHRAAILKMYLGLLPYIIFFGLSAATSIMSPDIAPMLQESIKLPMAFLGFMLPSTVYGIKYILCSVYDTGDFIIGDLYRFWKRGIKLIGLEIYFHLIQVLGSIFFFIPGVMWSTSSYFFDLYYLENPNNMMTTFSQSAELTKNMRMKILGMIITEYFLLYGIYTLLFGLIGIAAVSYLALYVVLILPAIFFARIHAYRQLQGIEPNPGRKNLPKQPVYAH